MNCKHCGALIPDGYPACPECGEQVLRRNGVAVAGMILGIVALVFCWVPYLGLILAVLGLVLSLVGVCKKNTAGKGKGIVGTVLAGIALMVAFIITLALSGSSSASGSGSSSGGNSVAATSTVKDEATTTTTSEDPEIAKADFVASCSEMDYKALARNPENYEGQNFSIICYVSSVRTAKDGTKYYIVYLVDEAEAQEKYDKGWYDSMDEALEYSRDYESCIWLYDDRDESDPSYVKILENDIILVHGTFNGMSTSKNSLTGETGEEVALDMKYVELLSE